MASSLDWSQCPAVESIPGKVSGAWVFRGTRVPVSAIFENLKTSPIEEVLGELPRHARSGSDGARLRRQEHTDPAGTVAGRMKIILDESVPQKLRLLIEGGHTVVTTWFQGWSG